MTACSSPVPSIGRVGPPRVRHALQRRSSRLAQRAVPNSGAVPRCAPRQRTGMPVGVDLLPASGGQVRVGTLS